MFNNKTLKQNTKNAFSYKVTEAYTEFSNPLMKLTFKRGHQVHIFAVGSVKNAPDTADQALNYLGRFLHEMTTEFAKGKDFSQMVMDKLAELRKEQLADAENQPHATEVEDEANLEFVRQSHEKWESMSRAERRRALREVRKGKNNK